MTVVLAGLRCLRCGGTSVRPVDPEDGLRADEVHACPHCFDEARASSYTIDNRYEVQGYRPTTEFVDELEDLESYEWDLGDLTPTQFEDFVAVRGYPGESYPARAADRGVDRSTVRSNVLRAAEKMRAGLERLQG